MTLVNIGNDTYINIDLIRSVFKRNDEFIITINDSSISQFKVNEKAFNTILTYGKAKI